MNLFSVNSKVYSILVRLFSNRYFWVTTVALVYMLFFDSFDLRSQWKMESKIEQLEKEQQAYLKSIEELKVRHQKLKADPKELEKLAREYYLMKRSNEDVFIIVNDSVN